MTAYTLVTVRVQILGCSTAIIAVGSRGTSGMAINALITSSVKVLGCSTTVIAIGA